MRRLSSTPGVRTPGSDSSGQIRDGGVELAEPDPHAELGAAGAFELVRTRSEWIDGTALGRVERTALRVIAPSQRLPVPAGLLASPLAIALAWLGSAAILLGSAVLLLISAVRLDRATPGTDTGSVEIELGPASAPPRSPSAAGAERTNVPAPAPVAPPVEGDLPAPIAEPDAAVAAAVDEVPADAAPVDLGELAAVREAFGRAVESGAAEAWQENGLAGYVVLGPSSVVDRSVCRNVAIWVEPAGRNGQVMDGRKCLGPDGIWVDSPQPSQP